jgi:aryl-alcohol dehydrogenase-like predicted oxidoreductase
MDYVLLGKTGLRVSRLALGTAAFGLERYGICGPDESGAVDENASIRLIRAAAERGINFFDTARGYGRSESILGAALAGCPSCIVATKLGVPGNGLLPDRVEFSKIVMTSIETSLRELGRDVLDIVQVHNATAETLESTDMLAVLETARRQGKLRFIGASVYGERNALAALRCDTIDTLQVALNLLDQRMVARVIPEAILRNVGLLVRSVFLKGVLTERVHSLPTNMQTLAAASEQARQILGETWQTLPRTAVRFCLSVPGVHSVLMGLRDVTELSPALAAEGAGPLPESIFHKAEELRFTDPSILDPSEWPIV